MYNNDKVFYICSYGGSGSTVLQRYLDNFGQTVHIHSKNPPKELTYNGSKNAQYYTYDEWFNNIKIPEDKLYNYKVIFIYKNPVEAIYSRFTNPDHLNHIQCDPTITIDKVIESSEDLFKIDEFFTNYTTKNNRNYSICCVKYEDLFDNLNIFNNIIGIPNIESLYPTKKETTYNKSANTKLTKIYQPLIDKMNKMKFIQII